MSRPARNRPRRPDLRDRLDGEDPCHFLAETGRSPSPQIRALVRGMERVERIDAYLEAEREEFGGRELIIGLLRGRRLQVAGDVGEVLDQDEHGDVQTSAPVAPSDAHGDAQAATDGGRISCRTLDDFPSNDHRANDERTDKEEEEFEADVRSALEVARSMFDDVEAVRERLVEECERDETRKHVVAALNRRIEELSADVEGSA
jgi:hypothetical protein